MKGEAKAKGEEIRNKLLPYQANLGILALILSIWNICWYSFLWRIFV
jgi:hypothetical protein